MSTAPSPQEIQKVLEGILVPGSDKGVLASGVIQSVNSHADHLEILADLPGDRAVQLALDASIKTAIAKAGFDAMSVRVRFASPAKAPEGQSSGGSGAPHEQGLPQVRTLDNIKHIIAIGSGKGGVGKSTATMNLAAAMAVRGFKVGILDADIYGPSIGKMAGYEGKIQLQVTASEKIIPISRHGIKMMSFSFLIDQRQSVAWRGPMLGKALEQFLFDIEWGELDYLFIDLPPGTGDVQLSLAQLVALEGAVIITTPQSVALFDAERAIDMFAKVNLPILGIVENMSEFICPNCGHHAHIFSSGGGKSISEELEVPLLGQIPISQKVMESGERGFPFTAIDKSGEDVTDEVKSILGAFDQVVANLEKALKE